MDNHDYIIYFIDRIFDVLIKKVFFFSDVNENHYW